jgi:hypothetical protein
MADTKAAATRSLDEAGCDTGDMLIAHRLLRFPRGTATGRRSSRTISGS